MDKAGYVTDMFGQTCAYSKPHDSWSHIWSWFWVVMCQRVLGAWGLEPPKSQALENNPAEKGGKHLPVLGTQRGPP